MLRLWDVNKKNSYPITGYSDYYVESTLKSSDKELSFSIPLNKKYSDLINYECYIETKTDWFVIKNIDENDSRKIVKAQLNLDEIEGTPWEKFESVEQTIKDCINAALVDSGYSVGACNIKKKRTIRMTNCSALDIINQARKTYRVEIVYDTKNKLVNIYDHIGSDKGSYLMDSINLKKLNIQGNTYDFYTKMIAIGSTDEDGNVLKVTVSNNSYSSKVKTCIWKDERYSIKEDLKEDAQAKLDEISKPYVSYSATPYAIDNASLGDTITVISKTNKIRKKLRIVVYRTYPEESGQDTIEVANSVFTFADIQKDFESAADTVNNITSDNGTVSVNAMQSSFTVLNDVNIQNFTAVSGKIGTLETTTLKTTEFTAYKAEIQEALIHKATVDDLTATNGKITTIESKTAYIDNLLNGNLTSANIQAGAIQSGSAIIAEGAIGDSQINSLSANKINSGTVDTAIVTIAGKDGRMIMKNNCIQVFDADSSNKLFERIALGDVNADGSQYGLRIRGKDGKTILYDENGQTKEGFTDGYSKLDDNSLDSKKIDINSVVTRINAGTTLITGTKVQVGDRSLDVAFSTLSNTVNANGSTLSSHTSSISALQDSIKLKLDEQTFTSYKSTNDSNISTINTNLGKATTSITALQGQITQKVSQTDIDNSINAIEIGGRNLLSGTSISKTVTGNNSTNQCIPIYSFVGNTASSFLNKAQKLRCKAILNNFKGMAIIQYNDTPWYKGLICSESSAISKIVTVEIPFPATSSISATGIEIRLDNASGSITIKEAMLVTGDKYRDWTPAPEDSEKEINDLNSNVTTISNKQAELTTSLSGITGRVSTAESNISTANGDITSLQNRVSAAESKITDSAIVTTVTSSTAYKDGLNGKVDLTTYNSKIQQLSDSIFTKVSSADFGSMIEQRPQNIMVGFNKINSNFILAENYLKMTLSNGDIAFQATEDGVLIAGDSTKIGRSVDILNESADRIISLENANSLDIILKDKHGNYYATPAKFGATNVEFDSNILGSGKKLGSEGRNFSEAWVGDYKKAQNGYTALLNGMILQWGYTNVQGSTNDTWVYFPLTFNMSNPIVVATVNSNNLQGGIVHSVWIESWNQYGFNARTSSPCNIKFIALGW